MENHPIVDENFRHLRRDMSDRVYRQLPATKAADGTRLPVYYSLHQTPKGWRAFDVRIEGISYVQNYRNQFNAEIGARGIDAVIARLKLDAAKVTTNAPGAGGK